MDNTKLFSVNWNDFGKGLLMAVIAVVLTGGLTLISATAGSYGTWAEWKLVIHSGVVAGISYIVKNFLTGEGGFLSK